MPQIRVHALTVVSVFIGCAALTALLIALLGPAGRADGIADATAAIAATGAALAAIYLSREALARTDRQLADAWQVTVLSRYPLLLPLHQSVTFPDSAGTISAHPPTEDRFRLDSPRVGSYAFVADTRDRFMIPVENAGEGPALRVAGRLWRSDGAAGNVDGPSALGAGHVAIMTTLLCPPGQTVPEDFGVALCGLPDPRPEALYYWLELSYIDVFGNSLGASALFDPSGLGAWRYIDKPRIGAQVTDRGHNAAPMLL
jgi:hypothetical protein